MEGCKARAREAGLRFQDETLEYIVTNRDLLELSPKMMIPTLYDYWVHDVEVLKEKGKYELYPVNPYETVINTRPAISFYNDNNPDWLNVMIFYHVLAHIDFFQNNLFYRHTWDYDFAGQALSDKRLIAGLRSEKGRWVDYVIEFSRSIDNLVGYHNELLNIDRPPLTRRKKLMDFYFDKFLQLIKKVKTSEYLKEIERYNDCLRKYGDLGEQTFFAEVGKMYPEFETVFQKSLMKKPERRRDLIQFLMEHSEFLNKEENRWMKPVLQVVRNTSIFFQPQIRSKIMNEGWASYWHEKLFLQDDRINGHEVEFARVHSAVTAMPHIGINPYALGMLLFYFIEETAHKGKYSFEFQRLVDADQRKKFDSGTGQGQAYIFEIRKTLCDSMFLNKFVDQDFVTRHKLFVSGKRLNRQRMVWEYYVKSRKANDYRRMLQNMLYHPPYIEINLEKSKAGSLYLVHHFEGKPLVKEFISNTMIGIEYLWGGSVYLETSEVERILPFEEDSGDFLAGLLKPAEEEKAPPIKWRRVLYSMENRKLSKKTI